MIHDNIEMKYNVTNYINQNIQDHIVFYSCIKIKRNADVIQERKNICRRNYPKSINSRRKLE